MKFVLRQSMRTSLIGDMVVSVWPGYGKLLVEVSVFGLSVVTCCEVKGREEKGTRSKEKLK